MWRIKLWFAWWLWRRRHPSANNVTTQAARGTLEMLHDPKKFKELVDMFHDMREEAE